MHKLLVLALFSVLPIVTNAGLEDFNTGPVLENYGENAAVENGLVNPGQQKFKVAFDVFKKNEGDEALRGINSVARFINMHVRAGVPLENLDIALVVHGAATFELMKPGAYLDRFDRKNSSAELLEQLLTKGVTVILCGQSAAFQDVASEDLLPGVQMSLSAMTAHALLQQEGYTLNPF